MQTLPVNKTCSSGVRGQQPDHNGNLQLIVQGKPGGMNMKRDIWSRGLKMFKGLHPIVGSFFIPNWSSNI